MKRVKFDRIKGIKHYIKLVILSLFGGFVFAVFSSFLVGGLFVVAGKVFLKGVWYGAVGTALLLLFAGVMYSANFVMPAEVWKVEDWKYRMDEYYDYLFLVRERNLKWSVVFITSGVGAALFFAIIDWYLKIH